MKKLALWFGVALLFGSVSLQTAASDKDDYEKTYRVQEYRQYQHPDIMAKINKTNAYSLLDNATGIVARKGKELLVEVDERYGDSLSIKIQNLLCPDGDGYVKGSSYYALKNGKNRIVPENDGLVYVMYHGKEADSKKTVKVRFLNGEVNGYFDISKHEPSQWKGILDNACYELIDVLGENVHLTFPVDSLKKYTPDGAELLKTFDRIVALEHEFMGLDRYHKEYHNRQYCHVVYKGYMYAPNYRTAYGVQTMSKVCDVKKLRTLALWGPSHEIGHIHQVRPGLKWHGMTEVTNNIYCLYVQDMFGITTRLQKEVERPTRMYDDCWYERSMTEYFTQGMAHNANPINHCRLVPFWQLHLYFDKVKGLDFYSALCELIRNTPDPKTDGECQLEFVRKACAVANMNLLPFFEHYGFLAPIDQEVNDYGKKRFVVTQQQIDRLRKEIEEKGYEPLTVPFWYITDNTVKMFKSCKPVERGIASCKGNTFTMTSWNNVVAYEVYDGDKLLFVSPLSSFTVEGDVVNAKTRLYAVGTDGKKTEVPFSWQEDKAQVEKMKKRDSRYKNMYNR